MYFLYNMNNSKSEFQTNVILETIRLMIGPARFFFSNGCRLGLLCKKLFHFRKPLLPYTQFQVTSSTYLFLCPLKPCSIFTIIASSKKWSILRQALPSKNCLSISECLQWLRIKCPPFYATFVNISLYDIIFSIQKWANIREKGS